MVKVLTRASMGGDARPGRVTGEPRDCNETAHPLRRAGARCERLRQFVTDGVSQATRSSLVSSSCPRTCANTFVEVKTRRATRSGRGPWEALHERKCRQVRRMAVAFLMEPGRPYSADLRFDAVGVLIDGHGMLVRLEHLEAAF